MAGAGAVRRAPLAFLMAPPTPSALSAIIKREIARRGPITFARFMRLALYHPEFGFYRRPRDPFGVHGDFYTASQLQPVFGEAITRFVRTLLGALSPPLDGVLELGAGRMDLSAALAEFGYRAFDWRTAPLPESFRGVVLANEFFDALPVHLLAFSNHRWRELRVASAPDGFQFVLAEPSPLLVRAAQRSGQFRTVEIRELRPQGRTWMKRIFRLLKEGHLVVIDYGYTHSELRRFPYGSLLSFQRHISSDDVLQNPGDRDITAHVDFSELVRVARREGLRIIQEFTLRQWLLSLWDEPSFEIVWSHWSQRERLQWKALLVEMGETFRVLVFSRAPATLPGK